MNKDVFERNTSTGITCDWTFLLPFLYVRRKVNYFLFISPTIFVLSSNKERLIAGYNQRRDLCLDANKFVSLTANSLIEVICLKIWQNHCPKKTKRPLPADLLCSKSPQLVRVPIAARVSWMYLVYILLNWSKPSAIHYSNIWLSQRRFLFSERSGKLFLVFQGTEGTERDQNKANKPLPMQNQNRSRGNNPR